MNSSSYLPKFPQDCPVRDVLDRIGDQWSVLVLHVLADGTLRFNELKRRIGDVSQHMLARTLKRLEQDGLVTRKLFPVIPPRVDYTLTPLGRSLLDPLRQLTAWADANHDAIRAARLAYRGSESTGPLASHQVPARPTAENSVITAKPAPPNRP